MQTLSMISFITEPRRTFRSAASEKNQLIGAFPASSIVFAEKFGQWDQATIEVETPLEWALGCLPQKTGGDISSRARYVSITPPSGDTRILLIDECDISETSEDTAEVTIKAYSPERWLDVVPSSISDANTDYSISQTYSAIIDRILTTYSTGRAEEQIGGVPFRDLPIVPFDRDYAPSAEESAIFGVSKGNSSTSPVDAKPAARIASVDVDAGFPEPQGERLSKLLQAFPYALEDVSGGQRVEYRQDFDYRLIPADSPYGDGCLWWRWAFRPRVRTARFFSRSNGTISDSATMHADSASSKIVYLPDDKDGNHRRNSVGFGGQLYPGAWASTTVSQANAQGVQSSDLTAADAAALAASSASSIKPIVIDITAGGDFSDVRPGMAASVRFGLQTTTMLINEIDFSYDADGGWSARIPVTSKTSSVDFIFVPRPDTTLPSGPTNPGGVDTGGIDWPTGTIPDIPGLPGDVTPTIPTPDIPDPGDSDYPIPGQNTNPVDVEVVEVTGDNAARLSVIRTKDGRVYALTTEDKKDGDQPFVYPVLTKISGIPSDAVRVSPFSIMSQENSNETNGIKAFSDAYFCSKNGKRLYRVLAFMGKKPVEEDGKLPGVFQSLWKTSNRYSASEYVICDTGVYLIKKSIGGGLEFKVQTDTSNSPSLAITDVIDAKSVTDKYNLEYLVLAKNGIFSYTRAQQAKLEMGTPDGYRPIGLASMMLAIYDRGVFQRSTPWKEVTGRFDGKISGFAHIGGSSVLLWTSHSIYTAGDSESKIKKIFSSKKEISSVHVSETYSASPTIVTYVDGGYTGLYSSGDDWIECATIDTQPISAVLGVEHGGYSGDSLGKGDDVLAYLAAAYSTRSGIYAPSVKKNSGVLARIPSNAISMAAGDNPVSGSEKASNDATIGGEDGVSVWSSGAQTYRLSVSWDGTATLTDISQKVGEIRDVEYSEGDFLMTGSKGLVDDTGAVKNPGTALSNPRIVPNGHAGGFLIPTDGGLWQVFPGMTGKTNKTMAKQIPSFGKIVFASTGLTASEEAGWIGSRGLLYPMPEPTDKNLAAPIIWMRPTLGLAIYKNEIFGPGKGNVGFVQRFARRAQVTGFYDHHQAIKRYSGSSYECSQNLRNWSSIELLWNGSKYAFIATGTFNGEIINMAEEYDIPAGKAIAGAVYGVGFITTDGMLYPLFTTGAVVQSGPMRAVSDTVESTENDFSGYPATSHTRLNLTGGRVIGLVSDIDNLGHLTTISVADTGTVREMLYRDFDTFSYVWTSTGIWKTSQKSQKQIYASSTISAAVSGRNQNGSGCAAIIIDKGSAYAIYEGRKNPVKIGGYAGSATVLAQPNLQRIYLGSDSGIYYIDPYDKAIKISGSAAMGGVRYTPIDPDDYPSGNPQPIIDSTGTMLMLEYDAGEDSVGTTQNTFSNVSEIHISSSKSQIDIIGSDESFGLEPPEGFTQAPWVITEHPHAKYLDSDGIYWGKRSMTVQGAELYTAVSLDDSYGDILSTWYIRGRNPESLALTSTALVSASRPGYTDFAPSTPEITRLLETGGKPAEILGRMGIFANQPWVRAGDDIFSVSKAPGDPVKINKISGITGSFLYGNPGPDSEDANSIGIIITTDGIFATNSTSAKKITGPLLDSDGNPTDSTVEGFTMKRTPMVASMSIHRTSFYNEFTDTIIIGRSAEDGGGAIALNLKTDCTLAHAREITELHGLGITLAVGDPTMQMTNASGTADSTIGSAILASGKRAWAIGAFSSTGPTTLDYRAVEITQAIQKEAEKSAL